MGLECKAFYKSPIGIIEITAEDNVVTGVAFAAKEPVHGLQEETGNETLKRCVEQLDQYFRGERKKFSVELKLQGTDFQNRVWKEVMKIPFGKAASYKDIAKAVGNPRMARAVGNANGKNRIAVIIPCHRVIGSNGCLAGYAWGLWRKEWLLRHEGITV